MQTAIRAVARGGPGKIEQVADRARGLGLLGWVRAEGEDRLRLQAEGDSSAVDTLLGELAEVEREPARVEGHEQFAIRGVPAGVFVVQEHQATAHHFDVRLEVDGVMRSWAVPKGPSMDPAVKRFAVQVEDHALSHNEYEGPNVIVWDRGAYEQGGRVPWPEALERGHAVFVLHGEKLHGGFALQRTRGGDKPQWLLIKRRDEQARPGSDVVTERPASVVSGRTLESRSGLIQSSTVAVRSARSATRRGQSRRPRSAKSRTVQPDDVKPETWLVVAGRPAPAPGATLNTPIVAASTYVLGGERIYSRNEATEGWEAFEAMLGGLEGGDAVAFSSGMAACAAVLGQLGTGAHLVLVEDCYQGVAAIAAAGARDHQWRVERLTATDPLWVQRASQADLLWLESPSNPLLEVADLEAICAAPRGAGTRVVVDNTFATPLVQRPLQLGADIVVHSATKLIGGHSDLLLGAAVAADPGELALLREVRGRNGATPGMLECFLALRGARTLALRVRQAQASAQQLAARLDNHATVTQVRYPGFGTIVSFELADAAAADQACRSTRIIRHATSLGGVETSMERRSAHPGQEHIPPGLIRLSVGCEDLEDLWGDLEAALDSG